MKRFILLLLLASSLSTTQAQTPGSHSPSPYIDSLGTLYWNRHQAFFLRIATSAADTGILLQSRTQPQYVNPAFFDTEGENDLRTRHAIDPRTGKPVSPPVELVWQVQADGTPPTNKTSFWQAPAHKSAHMQYYGPGLRATIAAHDALAGLQQIYYSTDSNTYQPYSDTLHYRTEGPQKLWLYSLDRVGNESPLQMHPFTVDLSPPQTKHIVEGQLINNVLEKKAYFSLQSTDALSGVGRTFFRIGEGPFLPYQQRIPTQQLADGSYQLDYYSVDNVQNQESLQSYTFYIDKLPPILASDILGDRFIVNEQIYFSGRTKLKITAVDNKSGVKDVMYSIDSDEFRTYDQPFYLPSIPGLHIVKYYAEDNLGNRTGMEQDINNRFLEYKHNVSKIYVDLTGPTLDYSFIGRYYLVRDTIYLNSRTRVKLVAKDAESGLQYTAYSVNGEQAETRYDSPFILPNEGENLVEVFGYDNVNNRNKWLFLAYVDNTPPQIITTFSILPLHERDALPVYSKHAVLYLAATDNIIGAESITYSLNGAPVQNYQGGVSNFKKSAINTIRIFSTDRLDNKAEQEIRFWIE